jgi:plastocyanin
MKRILSSLALILLLGCASSGNERPVVSERVSPDANGIQRVKITMHNYYFEPNRITVESGKPVELVLTNSDHVVPHNFSIHEGGLNISEDKWGFGNDTVRFTPSETGEFTFYCNKGDHAEEGMVGTLIVVE